MNVGFVRTEDGLSVFFDGTSHNVNRNNPKWKEIVEAISEENVEQLRLLVDVPKAVNQFTEGAVVVENGTVKWNGSPVHEVLTKRLLQHLEEGMPFKPLARFVDKLMQNPSRRSVEQAYPFIEHMCLKICPDGDFLAYKSVSPDLLDWHTKSVKNDVGAVISCRRNEVDDDPNNHCSNGFHVGAYAYASTFGDSNRVIVLCKVNPADIVSVPTDYECQKCRVCRYEVVELHRQEGPLTGVVHNPDGSVYNPDEVSFADECGAGSTCDDVDCDCHDEDDDDSEYGDGYPYDCPDYEDEGCAECEYVFDEDDIVDDDDDSDSEFDEDDVYPPTSAN